MYNDKNLYDIIIDAPQAAESVLKFVNGTCFDRNNNMIDKESASKQLLNGNTDFIIKPSRSNNGKGISRLIVQDQTIYLDGEAVTIHNLEEMYHKNFMIQKTIQQHSIMSAPHPSSVNTLRIVTFRWKNEIRYLLAFARFGANGDVKDNAGTGGVCLGITDTGEFLDIAIDENAFTYKHHPTTNFCFADLGRVPNYENFKKFAVNLHKNILHHDFISWDIAVGLEGQPIFVEANFSGATWIYQLAAQKPLFRDLTEEVLQYARYELKTNKPLLMKKDRKKKERKKIRQKEKIFKQTKDQNEYLKERNQELKLEVNAKSNEIKTKDNEITAKHNILLTKEHELHRMTKKYNYIKHSKSWRYTFPFRYVLALFKR